MYRFNTLCTLNLYSIVCQDYPIKKGKNDDLGGPSSHLTTGKEIPSGRRRHQKDFYQCFIKCDY